MKSHYICIALCALIALSCGGSTNNQSTNATPTPQLGRSDEEERAWQTPIENIQVREIYPTADGGAYALTINRRLWYIKEHWAYRVAESKVQLSRTKTTISDKRANFALLTAERQRIRKLLAENDDLQSELDEAKAKLEESGNEK